LVTGHNHEGRKKQEEAGGSRRKQEGKLGWDEVRGAAAAGGCVEFGSMAVMGGGQETRLKRIVHERCAL
jgi:hypothetical protein